MELLSNVNNELNMSSVYFPFVETISENWLCQIKKNSLSKMCMVMMNTVAPICFISGALYILSMLLIILKLDNWGWKDA